MNSKLLRLGLLGVVSILYIFSFQTFGQSNKASTPAKLFAGKDYQKVVDLLAPKLETLKRDDLLVLGKSYSYLKNHVSAIKIYQSLVSQNPKDFEARTLLGGEQLVSGKSGDALSSLKEALQVNPKHRIAYSLLIQYYESQPKINRYELRLLYEDMVANLGEDEESIIKLCDLCANDRLYDLSLKYCSKGISEYPKRSESYVSLGQTYADTGDTDKAAETLKKAADIFSKSDRTQFAYAKFLEEQKNYLSAYNYYKKAAQLNERHYPAFLGQASTGLELQKFEESLKIFESICKKDKASLAGYRKALTILRAQKNDAEIKKWLSKFEASLAKCEDF